MDCWLLTESTIRTHPIFHVKTVALVLGHYNDKDGFERTFACGLRIDPGGSDLLAGSTCRENCANLNTAVRKELVVAEYRNAIITQFFLPYIVYCLFKL